MFVLRQTGTKIYNESYRNVYFELTTSTKYNFKCVAIKQRVIENIILDDDTDKVKKVYFT